jgi:hypothetical protein
MLSTDWIMQTHHTPSLQSHATGAMFGIKMFHVPTLVRSRLIMPAAAKLEAVSGPARVDHAIAHDQHLEIRSWTEPCGKRTNGRLSEFIGGSGGRLTATWSKDRLIGLPCSIGRWRDRGIDHGSHAAPTEWCHDEPDHQPNPRHHEQQRPHDGTEQVGQPEGRVDKALADPVLALDLVVPLLLQPAERVGKVVRVGPIHVRGLRAVVGISHWW